MPPKKPKLLEKFTKKLPVRRCTLPDHPIFQRSTFFSNSKRSKTSQKESEIVTAPVSLETALSPSQKSLPGSEVPAIDDRKSSKPIPIPVLSESGEAGLKVVNVRDKNGCFRTSFYVDEHLATLDKPPSPVLDPEFKVKSMRAHNLEKAQRSTTPPSPPRNSDKQFDLSALASSSKSFMKAVDFVAQSDLNLFDQESDDAATDVQSSSHNVITSSGIDGRSTPVQLSRSASPNDPNRAFDKTTGSVPPFYYHALVNNSKRFIFMPSQFTSHAGPSIFNFSRFAVKYYDGPEKCPRQQEHRITYGFCESEATAAIYNVLRTPTRPQKLPMQYLEG